MRCLKISVLGLFTLLVSTGANAVPTFYTNMEHLTNKITATQHETQEQENSITSSTQNTLMGDASAYSQSSFLGMAGAGFSSIAAIGGGLLNVLKDSPLDKLFEFGDTGCGEINSESAAQICFYADNVEGSFDSITKTRKNISSALNQATDKMLSDSTTILNAVSEFDQKQDEQRNDLNKIRNTAEIQKNRTQVGLGTNEMALTSLNLRTNSVEVSSLKLYQTLNFSNINNPNNSMLDPKNALGAIGNLGGF